MKVLLAELEILQAVSGDLQDALEHKISICGQLHDVFHAHSAGFAQKNYGTYFQKNAFSCGFDVLFQKFIAKTEQILHAVFANAEKLP